MEKKTKKIVINSHDKKIGDKMPWYRHPNRNLYTIVMFVFSLFGVFVAYEISTIIYVDSAIKNGQVPVSFHIINLIRFVVGLAVGISSIYFAKKAYTFLYEKKDSGRTL